METKQQPEISKEGREPGISNTQVSLLASSMIAMEDVKAAGVENQMKHRDNSTIQNEELSHNEALKGENRVDDVNDTGITEEVEKLAEFDKQTINQEENKHMVDGGEIKTQETLNQAIPLSLVEESLKQGEWKVVQNEPLEVVPAQRKEEDHPIRVIIHKDQEAEIDDMLQENDNNCVTNEVSTAMNEASKETDKAVDKFEISSIAKEDHLAAQPAEEVETPKVISSKPDGDSKGSNEQETAVGELSKVKNTVIHLEKLREDGEFNSANETTIEHKKNGVFASTERGTERSGENDDKLQNPTEEENIEEPKHEATPVQTKNDCPAEEEKRQMHREEKEDELLFTATKTDVETTTAISTEIEDEDIIGKLSQMIDTDIDAIESIKKQIPSENEDQAEKDCPVEEEKKEMHIEEIKREEPQLHEKAAQFDGSYSDEKVETTDFIIPKIDEEENVVRKFSSVNDNLASRESPETLKETKIPEGNPADADNIQTVVCDPENAKMPIEVDPAESGRQHVVETTRELELSKEADELLSGSTKTDVISLKEDETVEHCRGTTPEQTENGCPAEEDMEESHVKEETTERELQEEADELPTETTKTVADAGFSDEAGVENQKKHRDNSTIENDQLPHNETLKGENRVDEEEIQPRHELSFDTMKEGEEDKSKTHVETEREQNNAAVNYITGEVEKLAEDSSTKDKQIICPEGLVPNQEENKHMVDGGEIKTQETVSQTIPISLNGDRPVEESLKQDEWKVETEANEVENEQLEVVPAERKEEDPIGVIIHKDQEAEIDDILQENDNYLTNEVSTVMNEASKETDEAADKFETSSIAKEDHLPAQPAEEVETSKVISSKADGDSKVSNEQETVSHLENLALIESTQKLREDAELNPAKNAEFATTEIGIDRSENADKLQKQIEEENVEEETEARHIEEMTREQEVYEKDDEMLFAATKTDVETIGKLSPMIDTNTCPETLAQYSVSEGKSVHPEIKITADYEENKDVSLEDTSAHNESAKKQIPSEDETVEEYNKDETPDQTENGCPAEGEKGEIHIEETTREPGLQEKAADVSYSDEKVETTNFISPKIVEEENVVKKLSSVNDTDTYLDNLASRESSETLKECKIPEGSPVDADNIKTKMGIEVELSEEPLHHATPDKKENEPAEAESARHHVVETSRELELSKEADELLSGSTKTDETVEHCRGITPYQTESGCPAEEDVGERHVKEETREVELQEEADGLPNATTKTDADAGFSDEKIPSEEEPSQDAILCNKEKYSLFSDENLVKPDKIIIVDHEKNDGVEDMTTDTSENAKLPSEDKAVEGPCRDATPHQIEVDCSSKENTRELELSEVADELSRGTTIHSPDAIESIKKQIPSEDENVQEQDENPDQTKHDCPTEDERRERHIEDTTRESELQEEDDELLFKTTKAGVSYADEKMPIEDETVEEPPPQHATLEKTENDHVEGRYVKETTREQKSQEEADESLIGTKKTDLSSVYEKENKHMVDGGEIKTQETLNQTIALSLAGETPVEESLKQGEWDTTRFQQETEHFNTEDTEQNHEAMDYEEVEKINLVETEANEVENEQLEVVPAERKEEDPIREIIHKDQEAEIDDMLQKNDNYLTNEVSTGMNEAIKESDEAADKFEISSIAKEDHSEEVETSKVIETLAQYNVSEGKPVHQEIKIIADCEENKDVALEDMSADNESAKIPSENEDAIPDQTEKDLPAEEEKGEMHIKETTREPQLQEKAAQFDASYSDEKVETTNFISSKIDEEENVVRTLSSVNDTDTYLDNLASRESPETVKECKLPEGNPVDADSIKTAGCDPENDKMPIEVELTEEAIQHAILDKKENDPAEAESGRQDVVEITRELELQEEADELLIETKKIPSEKETDEETRQDATLCNKEKYSPAEEEMGTRHVNTATEEFQQEILMGSKFSDENLVKQDKITVVDHEKNDVGVEGMTADTSENAKLPGEDKAVEGPCRDASQHQIEIDGSAEEETRELLRGTTNIDANPLKEEVQTSKVLSAKIDEEENIFEKLSPVNDANIYLFNLTSTESPENLMEFDHESSSITKEDHLAAQPAEETDTKGLELKAKDLDFNMAEKVVNSNVISSNADEDIKGSNEQENIVGDLSKVNNIVAHLENLTLRESPEQLREHSELAPANGTTTTHIKTDDFVTTETGTDSRENDDKKPREDRNVEEDTEGRHIEEITREPELNEKEDELLSGARKTDVETSKAITPTETLETLVQYPENNTCAGCEKSKDVAMSADQESAKIPSEHETVEKQDKDETPDQTEHDFPAEDEKGKSHIEETTRASQVQEEDDHVLLFKTTKSGVSYADEKIPIEDEAVPPQHVTQEKTENNPAEDRYVKKITREQEIQEEADESLIGRKMTDLGSSNNAGTRENTKISSEDANTKEQCQYDTLEKREFDRSAEEETSEMHAKETTRELQLPEEAEELSMATKTDAHVGSSDEKVETFKDLSPKNYEDENIVHKLSEVEPLQHATPDKKENDPEEAERGRQHVMETSRELQLQKEADELLIGTKKMASAEEIVDNTATEEFQQETLMGYKLSDENLVKPDKITVVDHEKNDVGVEDMTADTSENAKFPSEEKAAKEETRERHAMENTREVELSEVADELPRETTHIDDSPSKDEVQTSKVLSTKIDEEENIFGKLSPVNDANTYISNLTSTEAPENLLEFNVYEGGNPVKRDNQINTDHESSSIIKEDHLAEQPAEEKDTKGLDLKEKDLDFNMAEKIENSNVISSNAMEEMSADTSENAKMPCEIEAVEEPFEDTTPGKKETDFPAKEELQEEAEELITTMNRPDVGSSNEKVETDEEENVVRNLSLVNDTNAYLDSQTSTIAPKTLTESNVSETLPIKLDKNIDVGIEDMSSDTSENIKMPAQTVEGLSMDATLHQTENDCLTEDETGRRLDKEESDDLLLGTTKTDVSSLNEKIETSTAISPKIYEEGNVIGKLSLAQDTITIDGQEKKENANTEDMSADTGDNAKGIEKQIPREDTSVEESCRDATVDQTGKHVHAEEETNMPTGDTKTEVSSSKENVVALADVNLSSPVESEKPRNPIDEFSCNSTSFTRDLNFEDQEDSTEGDDNHKGEESERTGKMEDHTVTQLESKEEALSKGNEAISAVDEEKAKLPTMTCDIPDKPTETEHEKDEKKIAENKNITEKCLSMESDLISKSSLNETSREEILKASEDGENQNPCTDSPIDIVEHDVQALTEPNDNKVVQGSTDGVQKEMETLDSPYAFKAVLGEKGDYHKDDNFINDSNIKTGGLESITCPQSSAYHLEQSNKEIPQGQDKEGVMDEPESFHVSSVGSHDAIMNASCGNDVKMPLEVQKPEEESSPNFSSSPNTNVLNLHQKVSADISLSEEEDNTTEHGKIVQDEVISREEDVKPKSEELTLKEEFEDGKTKTVESEGQKTDQVEGKWNEETKVESDDDSPVKVEAPSISDDKAVQKKSHNILSGVGSKVKHSIAKVKKAITGKHSNHKPHSNST